MNKSKLLIALIAMSSTAAFAGGTVAPAPVEAPAAEAPAPAPAPMVAAPAPAPVAVAVGFVPSWYVGASIGDTKVNGGDGSMTGGKIFGGYRFNPNFAAELSYVDLGSKNGVRANGASLDVLGILPVGYNTDLFAKVGVADLNVHGGGGESGSKASANYGIGASYHFNHNVSGRIEAERYQKVGNDGPSANQYTVGVQYNF